MSSKPCSSVTVKWLSLALRVHTASRPMAPGSAVPSTSPPKAGGSISGMLRMLMGAISSFRSSPSRPVDIQLLSLRKRTRQSRSYFSPDKAYSIANACDTKKYKYQYPRRKMSFAKAHYHPFLFAMMTLSAMAELGLTAFLISAGNEHMTWPTPRYHSLLILFLFNAVWTTLFSSTYMMWMADGSSHFLANIASSVVWLLVTSVLWGTAAGVMHNTRSGGNCAGVPTISRCRQSLTVEALGWTEFGLCVLTTLATCAWVQSQRYQRKLGDSKSDLQRLV